MTVAVASRDPATGVLGAAANPRGAQGYAVAYSSFSENRLMRSLNSPLAGVDSACGAEQREYGDEDQAAAPPAGARFRARRPAGRCCSAAGLR